MKILFITDGIGKGGKERRMLELIKNLTTTTKHQIILVSLSDPVDYDLVFKLPIEFIRIKRKFKKDPFVFFKLFKIIKKYSPQIIHSWGSMSNIYSLPIAKLLRTKFITSVIADAFQNLSFRDKEYIRAKIIFPFADKITSNSISGLKAYKAPPNKSICIYNGFDQNRLSTLENGITIKQRLGIQDNVVIGMVAGFEERKDYSTLISAAKAVINLKPDSVFLLIGDGKLKQEMMQMVPDELNKGILFLGKIDNIESYINIFDIAILCTNTNVHQEGISNSIMEYMALGKPVIATEGGGTNEIVIDKITGFLVPAHDSKILTDKIVNLIENPQQGLTFGSNGRSRVNEFFSIDKMCSEFYSLYDQLIQS
jgi:glycosyltransferase involved in cell wall biosynthesis